MYSVIMIFLVIVGSLAGTIFLTNVATTNWLSKQELKSYHSIQTHTTSPKQGIYTVSVEEHYSIR